MLCVNKKAGFILNLIQQNLGCIQAALHTPCTRCCQRRCYCINCAPRHIHTAAKMYAVRNSENSQLSQQKSVNEVTPVSSEKSVEHIDVDREVYQKKESSLPTHDVQRLTSQHRKLELKADVIFDELTALRGANKTTFFMAVNSYISKETLYRRGAVEFIYSGLQRMAFFGVEKDLTAYKALIQVLPEGKMIPSNVWQVEFMHYPRQQQAVIDMLEQMENNAMIPDDEFGRLLMNRFGRVAHVTRKYLRMMYWMPKFKNINPYPVPQTLPADPIELALMALKRMSVDSDTKYTVYKTVDIEISPEEDTYIVSAQSPTQQSLLSKHNSTQPLFVEGPYSVYLRKVRQDYFLLRSEPDVKCLQEKQRLDEDNDNNLFEWASYLEEEHSEEKRTALSVHQQEDSTILGLCITGTSSKPSLVSWIRCLEKQNDNLSKTPVLFKLMSPGGEIEAVGDNRPFRKLQK